MKSHKTLSKSCLTLGRQTSSQTSSHMDSSAGRRRLSLRALQTPSRRAWRRSSRRVASDLAELEEEELEEEELDNLLSFLFCFSSFSSSLSSGDLPSFFSSFLSLSSDDLPSFFSSFLSLSSDDLPSFFSSFLSL